MNGRLMFLSRAMGHSSLDVTCKYFHYIPALHDKIVEMSGPSFAEMLRYGEDETCYGEE